jgi:putative MATE family efflux protein
VRPAAWLKRLSKAVLKPGRSRELILLAGPITLGMSSQIVLNLVDTAMVGRIGHQAQAAAGLGGFAFWMIANLALGIGTGVQTMCSRRHGEDRPEAAGAVLDVALIFCFVVALPAGWVLAQGAPWVFGLATSDPVIESGGAGYLAIRMMGLGAVVANYCFRGFYNGVGRPLIYMSSLVLIQVVNIFLNWVFIFGKLGARPMGVEGAALASVLAAVFGVAFYSIITVVFSDVRRVFRPLRFRNLLEAGPGRLLSLSWPESIRGVLVMLGFFAFLELHEGLGTREAAAGAILVNIASAGYLLALGFGLACATLVGRNLGRGDPEEARRMVWLGVRMATAVLVLPAAILVLAPSAVLAVFTLDQLVIETATPALQLFALAALVDALPIVLIYSLLGAGATRWVAGVQVIQQFVVMLPLAWLLAYPMGLGVLGLWIGMAGSRVLLALVAIPKFQGETWESIEV